jgi:hypothetical protein
MTFMKMLRLTIPIAVASVALLSGCSSFQSQWNETIAAGSVPPGLAGAWQGTWRSDVTGHNDQLRCIVTKSADGAYNARFHAKYHTVLTFGYTVPLTASLTNDLYHFTGSADLGWFAGGLYTYEGAASATNWNSTYTSKYDHGVFEMSRPR